MLQAKGLNGGGFTHEHRNSESQEWFKRLNMLTLIMSSGVWDLT